MTELRNSLRDATTAKEQAQQAILARLNPRGKRLLVTRPEVSATHGGRAHPSGLVIPDIGLHNLREFGMIAKILKISPAVDTDDILKPGVDVIIPEFCGAPIYLGGNDPDFWIIGVDDILCVILPDA